MSSLSSPLIFDTFHSNTTALPTEITTLIFGYILADARPLPLGGGVRTHTAHHPVASVSSAFRSIYFNLPYSTSTKARETTPAKLRIGEALEFSDLKTLSAFFEHGPGRDITTLHNVRFLSVSYLDDENATGWGQRTTDYAYEAFEYLFEHWVSMRISWLRLCIPYSHAILSVNDPGLWSLLKLRNLPRLIIRGPYGCITPEVRKHLKARTRTKKLFPWRPLGLENVGGRKWSSQMTWEEQYQLLDSRYKYLHDRETVTERRTMQRNAYHKRRRRLPMLSKWKKKGRAWPRNLGEKITLKVDNSEHRLKIRLIPMYI
ncbi:uncharacterized protein RSE6_14829 [Rhynchosporium secalis]|uniref:Uncharacterized protein n=1 Tax=Rhynchosporium secalis TaxID=38038 RepID=A0A1E1MWU1_RHYSE|nr:uncharacterized protein RSE6_14829 [Rhynchosporium secalis]